MALPAGAQTKVAGEVARWRAEGTTVWKSSHLLYLYGEVLRAWSQGGEQWPDGESFPALVHEIHAERRREGYDELPFARADWDRSLDFERSGRVSECRTHLERVVEEYAVGNPLRADLLLVLASYARFCREFERASDLLDQVQSELATAPPGPFRWDAEVHLAIQRASWQITIGMQDLAPVELERASELIELRQDELDFLLLPCRADLLLEQMNLALALDDYEAALSFLGEAQAQPWYEELSDSHKAEHELRRCIALAVMERLEPYATREARAALTDLLDLGGLPQDERWLAEAQLIDSEIREGDLEAAEQRMKAFRASIGGSKSFCALDLPKRRELDALVLGAHLAAVKGGTTEDLEQALADARRALTGTMERWRTAPTREGGLSILQTRDRLRVAEAFVEILLRCRGDEAGAPPAIEEIARVQALGSLARELGAQAPTLDEIRRWVVPSEGGLLLYVAGTWNSYAFCLDPTSISVHRLASYEHFDPRLRELLAELVRSTRSGARSAKLAGALQEVGRSLLPEQLLERIAGWKDMVVVGLEGTGYFPIELLPDRDSQPLGRRLAISYLPSLPVGVWLARERRPPADALTRATELRVVAATDAPSRCSVASALPSLEFGAAEEELLLSRAGFPHVSVRRGAEANANAMLDPANARAIALHVLAHTVESGHRDRPRALLLAATGAEQPVLSPYELERAHLPALVLMTACGAAEGPLRRGDDGRNHLGGALFLAGARTTILANVDVDYRSALGLFGDFYEGMARAGESPARAMLSARRAAAPDALLPYLMHVHGPAFDTLWNGPSVAAERGTRRLSTWIGLGVLLALSGLYLVRRIRKS